MVSIAAANIVEFLATFTISGFVTILFILVWILKVLYQRVYFGKSLRSSEQFVKHEDSFMVWLTWFSSCLIVAVLFSVFFADIYESFHDIDSSISILSLFVIYLLFMLLWVLTLFVWSKPTKSAFIAYILLVLATIVAIINTILVLLTLHDDSDKWFHFLVILLFIPPLCGFFATSSVHTYRELTFNEPKKQSDAHISYFGDRYHLGYASQFR